MHSDLSHASGLPLASFRREHVDAQIARACRREAVGSDGALAGVLKSDPVARGRFRRAVAISHAAMFRDHEQFALLEELLLPRLLAGGARVSAWSAGCADGSELYSLGIVLERLGALERSLLLGSDLLAENVLLARQGAYAGVSAALKARVRWERRDLVADGPPPGRWRLVLCRNVAIYLAPPARRRLYATLVASLGHHGVLLLGRSERLLEPARLGLRPIAPHAYERVAA